MEAPEVACPGSRRLTPRRFGLPPSRCGHPNSVSPILELALAAGAAFVPGGAGASSQDRKTFFFIIYFFPTDLQSFWQFLDAFMGYQVRSPGRAICGQPRGRDFLRPARALLCAWFQF